jgi:hypothetical protein
MQCISIYLFVRRPVFFLYHTSFVKGGGQAIRGTVSGQEVVNFSRCLVEMCGKVHVAPESGDIIPAC